jgi:hypothetical protein
MTLVARIANSVTRAGAAPARLRFWNALGAPGAVQAEVLRRILRDNADTAYGREYGFASIRSARDYSTRVPLADYDALAPWIGRMADGEARVLTAAPVRFMEPTGGSSGALKLVPYTDASLAEFSRATMAWVYDLLASRPALRGGRAYWAISPPGRRPSRTAGGIAIGMEHDSDYFPAPLRALLQRALAVPGLVARAPDIAACRYLTLRALLAAPDLRLISVWSPSFLTLLASELDARFAELLLDLEDGEVRAPLDPDLAAAVTRTIPARPTIARELRRRFGRRPPEDLGALWEELALISCWADGHAARALDGVRRRFPRVEIQPKGLLATEGVVSIPLFGYSHPVAAVMSHYLEFLPDGETTRATGVDDLEHGATYEVVLTTGGGLCRYRLRDLVRVEGFVRSTPMLSFRGRADRASDLAGEKLTAAFAEHVLSAAMTATGIRSTFAMLVPSVEPVQRYLLCVDASREHAEQLASAVERELLAAHHYALCRGLGQLQPVHGVAVSDGERSYEHACAERGQRVGTIKPPALDPALGWERRFTTNACRPTEVHA